MADSLWACEFDLNLFITMIIINSVNACAKRKRKSNWHEWVGRRVALFRPGRQAKLNLAVPFFFWIFVQSFSTALNCIRGMVWGQTRSQSLVLRAHSTSIIQFLESAKMQTHDCMVPAPNLPSPYGLTTCKNEIRPSQKAASRLSLSAHQANAIRLVDVLFFLW